MSWDCTFPMSRNTCCDDVPYRPRPAGKPSKSENKSQYVGKVMFSNIRNNRAPVCFDETIQTTFAFFW